MKKLVGFLLVLFFSFHFLSAPVLGLAPREETAVSFNWAGYVAAEGVFTGVSASWVIAAPQSSDTFGVDAAWVGIGGVSSHDLIQAGTQTIVDYNGNVFYEAFYEVLPDVSRPLDISVAEGDSVTVSVNQESPGQWLIFFKNNTSAETFSLSLAYDSSLSSAEWITEAPSGRRSLLPLNDFGKIQFKDAAAVKNGKITNIEESGARLISMANFAGELLTDVSSLGNDGASFTVSRTDKKVHVFRPRFLNF